MLKKKTLTFGEIMEENNLNLNDDHKDKEEQDEEPQKNEKKIGKHEYK